MVDEPDGQDKKPDNEQNRNRVRIEGDLVLVYQNERKENGEKSGNTKAEAADTSVRGKICAILTSSNFWVALGTIVIAGFTVALYCVSEKQWQTMQRQLDDSEAVERAQLVVVEPITVDVEVAPKPAHVKFSIKNVGQSIADNIGIIGSGACSPGLTVLGQGPGPNTRIVSQPNPSGGSLAQGDTRSVDMPLVILPGCVPSPSQPNTYAFLQIIVSYTDIFRHNRVMAYSTCYSPQTATFHMCVQGQITDQADENN